MSRLTEMVPSDALTALTALNGHARAYGCGKRAIYEYKTLASALAIAAGAATVQLRQWTGTCGACGGSGRYVDLYGERWPHCRACSSTGRVTLKFTEVAIANGPIWHHPFESSAGRDLAALAGAAVWDASRGGWRDTRGNEPIFWNITDGWAPRLPGERLAPDGLADALNLVETWLLDVRVPIGDRYHWIHERARAELRRYHLDIGRLQGPCFRCGATDVVLGLGRIGPPFSFAWPVCRTHQRLESAFWPCTVPDSALTPALIEWRDRHVAIGFQKDGVFYG